MAIEWKKIAFVENSAAQSVLGNPTGSPAVASAITVAEQTLVGRITGGNVDDLSVAQVQTLLGIGGATVSDTAYSASWDGVTDVAPSKNAVFDKIELLAPKDDPVFTGVVSASEQPYFYAYVSSKQNDVTGDDTAYNITGAIWTEIEDIGNCFSNGTFTAPVTGRYLFSGCVALASANCDKFDVFLVTTDKTVIISPIANSLNVTNWSYLRIPFCQIMDLDASDTAYLRVQTNFASPSKITDIAGSNTRFYGYLLP